MEQHLNLIRSIAWNFHRTTGIQWQELFSEACLAYCESLQSHNPKKGAVTTLVYTSMKNALINFCKREGRNYRFEGELDWFETSFTPVYEFFEEEYASYLSPDTIEILRMIRSNPQRYLSTPRKSTGLMCTIKNDLVRDTNWSWPRICRAVEKLRKELLRERCVRTVWKSRAVEYTYSSFV